MNSNRLRISYLLMACFSALVSEHALADDEWFQKQFNADAGKPVVVARPRPATNPATTALPAMNVSAAAPSTPPTQRPWNTIVVPAPRNANSVRVASTGVFAPAVPQARPLTGYAHELSGLASYYWQPQMTSSGERFDRRALTAAHKTLPLGTQVRVTNLANGKSTMVRINDRGPFKGGRVIDLSEAAALQLDMTGPGIARVAMSVVQ